MRHDIVGVLQAHRYSLAVIEGRRSLTYQDLLQLGLRVAERIDRDHPTDRIIAIKCGRLTAALPVMLGCLLSGRTYLMLDSDAPQALIVNRMQDSGAEVLFFDDIDLIEIGQRWSHCRCEGGIYAATLESRLRPIREDGRHDWVYYLYTSGSSGFAQCIAHSWPDIVHMAHSYARAVGMRSGDRVAMFASLGHDAAVVDIYSCLLSGASIVRMDVGSPWALRSAVRRMLNMEVTMWHSVPTVLDLVVDQIPVGSMNGVRVVLGGESVRLATLERLWKDSPGAEVYGLYGQTECSVISGSWLRSGTDISGLLGVPMEGVEWQAVKKCDEEAANLWVRSPSAATHRIVGGEPVRWRRSDEWYDTGDLVEVTGEGLRFVGRSDQVVNIAGHRIDLLEIERYVNSIPGVLDSVVASCDVADGRTGIGCVVYSDRGEIPLAEINVYLSEFLPARQLLSASVSVDSPLPRTSSGKRDRRKAVALLSRS